MHYWLYRILRWSFAWSVRIVGMIGVSAALGAFLTAVVAFILTSYRYLAFAVLGRTFREVAAAELLPVWGYASALMFVVLSFIFWPRKVEDELTIVRTKAPQPPSP